MYLITLDFKKKMSVKNKYIRISTIVDEMYAIKKITHTKDEVENLRIELLLKQIREERRI